MVCGALQEVRRLNLKVVPQCWFVREVIERYPEFRDLVRWFAGFGYAVP